MSSREYRINQNKYRSTEPEKCFILRYRCDVKMYTENCLGTPGTMNFIGFRCCFCKSGVKVDYAAGPVVFARRPEFRSL